MSVIGQSCAVVSLGMSCQTAHQIQANVVLLRDVFGDPTLAKAGMPFDWLICPTESAASLLRARTFYPSEGEMARNVAPWWERHNVFFWHEFGGADEPRELAVDEDREVRAKYAHKARHLDRARHVKRLICVVSNTQNNLSSVAARTSTFEPMLSNEKVRLLREAAEGFFGREVEMLVVSYADRFEGGPPCEPTFFLKPDESVWVGDVASWAKVFAAFASRTRPKPTQPPQPAPTP